MSVVLKDSISQTLVKLPSTYDAVCSPVLVKETTTMPKTAADLTLPTSLSGSKQHPVFRLNLLLTEVMSPVEMQRQSIPTQKLTSVKSIQSELLTYRTKPALLGSVEKFQHPVIEFRVIQFQRSMIDRSLNKGNFS